MQFATSFEMINLRVICLVADTRSRWGGCGVGATEDEALEAAISDLEDGYTMGNDGGLSFWRSTDSLIMSGDGCEFDTIEELKKAISLKSVNYDLDFNAPGFRWEITDLKGDTIEKGIGKPPWA